MITKTKYFISGCKSRKGPWQTPVSPPTFSASIWKNKEGKRCKVNSILWMPTHCTAAVLVPGGLIFDMPTLSPTSFPSKPQANFYNFGTNSFT